MKKILVLLFIVSGFYLQSCAPKEKKEEVIIEKQDSIPLEAQVIDTLVQKVDSVQVAVEEVKVAPKPVVTTIKKPVVRKPKAIKVEPKNDVVIYNVDSVKPEEPKIDIMHEPDPVKVVTPVVKEEPKVVKPVIVTKNYTLSTGNKVSIKGTSSLHDWEEVANDYTCTISTAQQESSFKFETLTFNVKAKSIKSDKDLMDKKTYEALKADKFPEITFKMTSPVELDLNQDTFKGTITGNLTMAGVTKTISVPVNGKKKTDNSFQISGSKKIKMTDYKMEPPTALMGSIKTGDEVTINFTLNLQAK
jgi:polyisoprenoid-binding protein YceI